MKILCPVCNIETDTTYIGKYKNKSKIFDNKSLFQCQYCKIIFVHPIPTIDELEFYYNNIWRTTRGTESELVYQIQADERLRYLSRHIDLHGGMKVLDVGSGTGHIYDGFLKRGLKVDFYATDPNPDNLQSLKIKVVKAFADLKEIKRRDFDLVAVCHVLEHITEPVIFLRSAMEYVKEGGYIFIELPERDDTFKAILEPHVAVYTIESLTNLVNKVGLEVTHITGYGRKRSKLIAELDQQKNILTMTNAVITIILNRVNRQIAGENIMHKKIKELYKYYKFDKEGTDRWWIRAILRKPKINICKP